MNRLTAVFMVALLSALVLLAACARTSPAPTPTVNMDVGVGTPPPEGWKWVVAEYATGATEVKEEPTNHGFYWVYFVISGSHEITAEGKTTLANAGQGIMVPAKQQHSHRYPAQSKILIFDARSTSDNPTAFHRGSKLIMSDKLALRASAEYKLRVRTFTLAAGQSRAEESIADPNFVYVTEGTLTTSVGKDVTRTEAGKTSSLLQNTKFVMKNEGKTPLSFVVADVHP